MGSVGVFRRTDTGRAGSSDGRVPGDVSWHDLAVYYRARYEGWRGRRHGGTGKTGRVDAAGVPAVGTEPPAGGRSLVSGELFDRLTRQVITDDGLDPELAERVVDQALAFLAACAANVDSRLAPSPLVDLGWHAFLLHTKDYAGFCDRIAGRFMHHVPTGPDDATANGPAAREIRSRTVAAIEALGMTADTRLWPSSALGECTGCHNGCHDDPPPARR